MATTKKPAAKAKKVAATSKHPFAGKYCIFRTYSAGVHAGVLREVTGSVPGLGETVIVDDSRRLWSWSAKSGVALSGVAVHGLASGKVDSPTTAELSGVVEKIPCTPGSEESIRCAK